MAGLFQTGDFTLHSGAKSGWKIECDALTDGDIEALALMLSERLGPFKEVVGVPRGGLRIADAVRKYVTTYTGNPVLIVDDVLTSGGSMNELRRSYSTQPVIGAVLFARGETPVWVTALFQMDASK